jgi:hypothetical protein
MNAVSGSRTLTNLSVIGAGAYLVSKEIPLLATFPNLTVLHIEGFDGPKMQEFLE